MNRLKNKVQKVKQRFLKLFLLLSLFFNSAHAYIIVEDEHCTHQSSLSFVVDISQSDDCGDMCDLHYLFHWSAIVTPYTSLCDADLAKQKPQVIKQLYTTLLITQDLKPPIRL